MLNIKSFLIAVFVCLTMVGYAQIVNIPDANFKTALLNHIPVIDTSGDGEIQFTEASSFNTSIDVSSSSIGSLIGIEAFTALTSIHCYNNQLTTLDVSQNLALEQLLCQDNQLTSLILPPSSALGELDCSFNNLTALDVSQNPGLILLYLQINNLTVLNVSQNPALEILICSVNDISNLTLPQSSAITELYCESNNLTSIDVSFLPSLNVFECFDNNLADLDLSQNSALQYLDCNGNLLSSLDLRNGNNSALIDAAFNITNNINLNCISVDDPVWSTTNWTTNIDPQNTFNANCNICGYSVNVDSVLNRTCVDSGQIWTSVIGGVGPFTYNWSPLMNAVVINNTQLTTNTGGFYTLTVSDGSNCETVRGVVVNGPSIINNFDLTVNGSQFGVFRPGLISSFDILAKNDGCLPVSGQLQVIYSGPLSFVNTSSIAPDVINGDTLSWNFTNWIYDLPQFMNSLNFKVDSTAAIGEQVCFDINITPVIGDIDSTNNVRSYCYDIVNSYDPNDKQVYPQGKCDPKYVLADDKLTYTVRFQNTGNADAINIYILDSLDADLELTSIRIIASSHEPLITEVLDDNVLKFRFDNINLPDSNSNEPASHGFVIYEISPLPGLFNGTEINNQAAIYFDLNAPIFTNTVFNTIIDLIPVFETEIFDTILDTENYTLPNGTIVTQAGVYESTLHSSNNCDSTVIVNLHVKNAVGIKDLLNSNISFSLYPNPASSAITLELSDLSFAYNVEIQNLLGQKVYTSSLENTSTLIPTTDWSNGIYHVLIRNKEGLLLGQKKLVVLR